MSPEGDTVSDRRGILPEADIAESAGRRQRHEESRTYTFVAMGAVEQVHNCSSSPYLLLLPLPCPTAHLQVPQAERAQQKQRVSPCSRQQKTGTTFAVFFTVFLGKPPLKSRKYDTVSDQSGILPISILVIKIALWL